MTYEELKLYQKARYAQRKAAGLCIQCGKPAKPGQTRCAEHAAEAVKKSKENREWFRKRGRCIYCGKEPIYKGASYCESCAERQRKYYQTNKKGDKS